MHSIRLRQGAELPEFGASKDVFEKCFAALGRLLAPLNPTGVCYD